MAPPPSDENRGRRRRRDDDDWDDDDDDDRPNPGSEMTWADKQFTNTGMVVLVIFSLCCGMFALIFGIVGLATCKDPDARQKALIVTVISAFMLVAYFVLGFVSSLSGVK